MTSLAELERLSAEQADRFFAEVAPVDVVRLLHDATDHDLRTLALVEHVREPAVRHVLERMPELAVADRLTTVRGTVDFRLTMPRHRPPEVHGLVFDGKGVTVTAPGHADVTITTDAVDFFRLISGAKNAALLLLSGKLEIEGDELLALQVGGVFQVPGQPGVAVDPAAVDPVDVADVLGHVKDQHLDAVMAGAFRGLILEQVFAQFPGFLDAERAARTTLTVGFTVNGRADGGADRYVVRVVEGCCTVSSDATDRSERDATITLSGAHFLKLVTGHLNPLVGIMKKQLKVRGDKHAVHTLHKIMRVPGQ